MIDIRKNLSSIEVKDLESLNGALLVGDGIDSSSFSVATILAHLVEATSLEDVEMCLHMLKFGNLDKYK